MENFKHWQIDKSYAVTGLKSLKVIYETFPMGRNERNILFKSRKRKQNRKIEEEEEIK